MWLVDTNVVSELRRKHPSQKVENWLRSIPPDSICVSVVTLGEIQLGIEKLRGREPERATALDGWLDSLAAQYNVIELDAAMWRLWAKLIHKQDQSLYEDALIAATALTRGFCVVTRDVGDFARWDVRIFDPFA